MKNSDKAAASGEPQTQLDGGSRATQPGSSERRSFDESRPRKERVRLRHPVDTVFHPELLREAAATQGHDA